MKCMKKLATAACGVASMMLVGAANAQTAPLQSFDRPANLDSGVLVAPGVDGMDRRNVQQQLLFSDVVGSPGAPWVRLQFGETDLAGLSRHEGGSFLIITSLRDGAVQYLDATTIQQWQYTSAYFNGDMVQVQLYAMPGTENRVSVVAVTAGEMQPVDHDGIITSICGTSDDRTLSNGAPDARLLPIGCSGFLFNSNQHCLLAAGHCVISSAGNTSPTHPDWVQVVEFNVPLSNANGTINFAHPDDQYPADPASMQAEWTNPIGNDWMYFGAFANSNTGLTPLQAQGSSYTLAASAPSSGTPVIRIRGYGTTSAPVSPTWNQVQKTHNGPYAGLSGTRISYVVDTTGGNSGSAVWRLLTVSPLTGNVIGIHTNAGCTSSGGANNGTAIQQANLQNALANPQGICNIAATCSGAAGNCYISNGSPGCNNTACCSIVCQADPFCCNTNWDGLCANQALSLCADCGTPGAGNCFSANGSPGCNDSDCCAIVCADDPFCCNTAWDGFCAAAAIENCSNCGEPGSGSCYSSNGSPGCINGDCCEQICASDPFCCGTTWDSVCATAALANCTNCGDPTAGNCYTANGTPGCSNGACCETVCASDPYCCDTAWDSICASSATSLCGNCGSSSAGNCFIANGSPGCSNASCCAQVCAADPFCCNVTWDGACASGALDLCTDCGDPSAGSCYTVNGSASCNDEGCCAQVCAADPFCCNTNWDSACATQAAIQCAGCGSPGAGSCTVANGTPGCDDQACCTLICSQDPFCCANNWDGICASAAANDCNLSTCTGDLNGDNVVNVSDLLILLGAWGSCPSCAADLNGDNVVNVSDLLILLGAWGACP